MTPEQTLLARIVENNPPRKLLELLLAHDGLAVGVELNQGEIDVLRELEPVKSKRRGPGMPRPGAMSVKPVKLDVVYDLKDMRFDPDSDALSAIGSAGFSWAKTPEGVDYWYDQFDNPTQEGRDKIAAMREQFERENA